jgi:hypothetical protein
LLVHAERIPQIRYQIDQARYGRLHFAGWIPVVGEQTRLDGSSQEYGDIPETTLVTEDPGTKATLEALNERWPWTLSRQDLLDTVEARLVAAGVDVEEGLSADVDNLLELLIARGQVRYRLDPVTPPPATVPYLLDEPARLMAELTLAEADAVTFNSWHESIPLSDLDRYTLPLLDGTRDRDQLVAALTELAAQKLIEFDRDGKPVSGDAETRSAAADYVDALPDHLAKLKLAITAS